MSLSACIPFAFEDEKLFQTGQVAFIEIGQSTKEDISAAISNLAIESGETDVGRNFAPTKFQDGKWWLYTQNWSSDRWLFVVWPIGPYETGDSEYRFLLINFDDKDVVTHYELSTLQRDGCNRSGICKKGPDFSLLARSEDVRVAKLFDGPVNGCGVYLYTKASLSLPISRDGYRVGRLADNDHFLYWQFEPGAHQLKSISLDDLDLGPIEFDCAAGELYFFELDKRRRLGARRRVWIEFVEQDSAEGRREIADRQLILSTVPITE